MFLNKTLSFSLNNFIWITLAGFLGVVLFFLFVNFLQNTPWRQSQSLPLVIYRSGIVCYDIIYISGKENSPVTISLMVLGSSFAGILESWGNESSRLVKDSLPGLWLLFCSHAGCPERFLFSMSLTAVSCCYFFVFRLWLWIWCCCFCIFDVYIVFLVDCLQVCWWVLLLVSHL